MSLKSFLKKIGDFFSNLFKSILPELKKAIAVGVTITDAVKNFDLQNSSTVDIITALIPGDLDNEVVQRIREKLPMVVTELKLVDATLNLTDPDEIVAAAVKTMQQLSGDYRSAFLNSFSIIVAQVAADGKLDWNDAVYLLKWYYDNRDVEDVDTTI